MGYPDCIGTGAAEYVCLGCCGARPYENVDWHCAEQQMLSSNIIPLFM
jgi:hypothetical protein